MGACDTLLRVQTKKLLVQAGLGRCEFLRHRVLDLKLLLLDAVYQFIVWERPGFFGFELRFEFGMFHSQGRQMIFAHRYLLLACRQESRFISTRQSQGEK